MNEIAINVFIIVFLFYIWAWSAPKDAISRRLIKPATRIILWLDLEQSWGMFCPNPPQYGRHLQVQIMLINGDSLVWDYPCVNNLPRMQAFFQMRYSAYLHCLLSKRYPFLRLALAEYLLAKYDFADNPPFAVRFLSYTQKVAPPGKAVPNSFPHTRTVLATYKLPLKTDDRVS